MRTQAISITLLLAATVTSLAMAQDEDSLDIEDLFNDDFESQSAITINDPLEGVNRVVFKFNDALYSKVAKPFAKTYSNIMPDRLERGLGNVFDNLKYPSRLVGNILQGRLGAAGKETGQFVVNTTIGIGGFFRPSDEFEGLQTSQEDIGQAFGSWGVGHGFYVVIPFIGPTSARDFTGDFLDGAVNPIPQPWSLIDNDTDRLIFRSVDIVNRLPGLMQLYDSMRRSAIDPYSSVRDAYAQRRARLVNN